VSLPARLGRLVDAAIADEAPGPPQRILRGLLTLLGAGYGVGMRLRNAAYDRGLLPVRRLPCRVICVGNLTVGGTGKTPTVAWLAGALREAGCRVAVVLRGYGGAGGVRVASDGAGSREDWRLVGDEAALLAARLPGVPVVTGADRHAAGRLALERFLAQTIVLDDGFQHRRLHRDLDLVLVDATDPFGGGRLLPRGRLRERVEGLCRAHGMVVTRAAEAEVEPVRRALERLAPGRPVGWTTHRATALVELSTGRTVPLGALAGARVLGVAGIARPRSFRRTLAGLGAQTVECLIFPDHHPYGEPDRGAIGRAARQGGVEALVTTEKDAVRLGSCLPVGLPAFAVRIDLEWLGGSERLLPLLGVTAGGRHG